MFIRVKRSKKYEYLQIVHNERVEGRVRQRTIATLGRLDVLRDSGVLDALTTSLAKHALHTAALSAHERGDIPAAEVQRVGPVIIFERLWNELRMPQILATLLNDRRFEFAIERVLFVTVLHRLISPGSDRAAEPVSYTHLTLPTIYAV